MHSWDEQEFARQRRKRGTVETCIDKVQCLKELVIFRKQFAVTRI